MIIPNWPAPKNIHAFTTTRDGGVSLPPYDSFNLAAHVGDDPEHVAENRRILSHNMNHSRSFVWEPIWLTQTHSTTAVRITHDSPATIATPCDASFTRETNLPCAVLTADCLPLLICNEAGTEVAAIHAGWRGLLAGIIENTIPQLSSSPADLLVWLGPAIGPTAFNVDDNIRLDFINRYPQNKAAFKQTDSDWLADFYALSKTSLEAVGVSRVYGGDYCTVSDKRFFSYRRDNGVTGRMASVIYIAA